VAVRRRRTDGVFVFAFKFPFFKKGVAVRRRRTNGVFVFAFKFPFCKKGVAFLPFFERQK